MYHSQQLYYNKLDCKTLLFPIIIVSKINNQFRKTKRYSTIIIILVLLSSQTRKAHSVSINSITTIKESSPFTVQQSLSGFAQQRSQKAFR